MAQLVEQRIRNAWVPGSSPGIGSKMIKGDAESLFSFKTPFAELAQLVEHWLPKPRVAGSSPVFRSSRSVISHTFFFPRFLLPFNRTNENKSRFILHFARLFVPLQAETYVINDFC